LYYTPADAPFNVQKNQYTNGVQVSIPVTPYTSVGLYFASADGAPLKIGLYDRALSPPASGTQPVLDVSVGSAGPKSGWFLVKEIVYGSGNTILKFDASFSIQERDSGYAPYEGEIYFNATATPTPRHHITSKLEAFATRGQPFRYQVTGSGDESSYAASGLPAGLAINSDGIITGTPETEGTYNIVISAASAADTASATLTLKVDPPSRSTGSFRGLLVLPEPGKFIEPADAVQRTQDEGVFARRGGPNGADLSYEDATPFPDVYYSFMFSPPYGQTMKVGAYENAAPYYGTETRPGLGVSGPHDDCVDGGSFVIHEFAYDAAGLLHFHASFTTNCTDGSGPALTGEVWYDSERAITSSLISSTRVGQPFQYQIVANNLPTSFGATGLPPGLTVNPVTGVISGTPSQAGFFTATITATGANGTATSAFAITVLPPSLVNISTRMNVAQDDKVLIGGFIISGTAKKKLMIRGIGPSLAVAGVNGALPDPKLELHNDRGDIIAFNDDWKVTATYYDETPTDQRQEIEQSGIAPKSDLESAVIVSLYPGTYTVIANDATGKSGIGLVEVYDLGTDRPEYLANISTRGYVRGGDDAMIGGIIVEGANGTTSRVVVRAIGPSLAKDSLIDALPDPQLELHDQNGALVASNDNWQTSQQAELESLNLAPTDPKEAALVKQLAPGAYTAIVRGHSDRPTGLALVEAYDVR
jgi:hypothetical protein